MPLNLLRYLCPRSAEKAPATIKYEYVRSIQRDHVKGCLWINSRVLENSSRRYCSARYTHKVLVKRDASIGEFKIELEETYCCTRHLTALRKKQLAIDWEKCTQPKYKDVSSRSSNVEEENGQAVLEEGEPQAEETERSLEKAVHQPPMPDFNSVQV